MENNEKNKNDRLYDENHMKALYLFAMNRDWGARFPLRRCLSVPGYENDVTALYLLEGAHGGRDKIALLDVIAFGGEGGPNYMEEAKAKKDSPLFELGKPSNNSPDRLKFLPKNLIYARNLFDYDRLIFHFDGDMSIGVTDGETGELWKSFKILNPVKEVRLLSDVVFYVICEDGTEQSFLLRWSYKREEWERNDPEERLKYILNDKVDLRGLINLARFDEDDNNRTEAYLRIADFSYSFNLLKSLKKGLKDLSDHPGLNKIIKNAKSRVIKILAASVSNDSTFLLDLAKSSEDRGLRQAAWERLNRKNKAIWDLCFKKYGVTAAPLEIEVPKIRPRRKITEITLAISLLDEPKRLKALEERLATAGEEELSENYTNSNALMWAAEGSLAFEKLSILNRLRPSWVSNHIGDLDDDGHSPLHYLASGWEGNAEALKLLVSWGVDINLRDYTFGRTALHDFALYYQGVEELVETFLSFDPEIYEDSEGHTAAYYERDSGNRDVLIAEYMAERFRRTGKDSLPYIPPSKRLKHSNDVYKDWEKKAGSLDRFLEAHEDGQYDRLYNDLLYGDELTSCLHIFFPLARDLFKQSKKTFRYYGISGLDEAREYLSHRILGKRLCDLVKVLIDRSSLTRKNVLYESEQDHMQKFLTLFALADKDGEKGLFSGLMKSSGVSFHKKTAKILGFF